MLTALYHFRQLMLKGKSGFVGESSHGGVEPYYPPLEKEPDDWFKSRVDAEIIRASLGGVDTRFQFTTGQGGTRLAGMESVLDKEEDPCEIHFDDYREVGGKSLPFRISVFHGGRPYCRLEVQSWDLK